MMYDATKVKVVYIGQPNGIAKKFVPERHGKWIKDKPYYNSYNAFIEPVHCSECGWHEYDETKYCPNCGAKMEE